MSVVDQIILLHDVDSKLFEINKLLGGLPGQVEELATQEQNLKNSLIEKYDLLIKEGKLNSDPFQILTLEKLNEL